MQAFTFLLTSSSVSPLLETVIATQILYCKKNLSLKTVGRSVSHNWCEITMIFLTYAFVQRHVLVRANRFHFVFESRGSIDREHIFKTLGSHLLHLVRLLTRFRLGSRNQINLNSYVKLLAFVHHAQNGGTHAARLFRTIFVHQGYHCIRGIHFLVDACLDENLTYKLFENHI